VTSQRLTECDEDSVFYDELNLQYVIVTFKYLALLKYD